MCSRDVIMKTSHVTGRVRPGPVLGLGWAPRPMQRFSKSNIYASKPPRTRMVRSTEKQRHLGASRTSAPAPARPPTADAGDMWPTTILKDASRLGLLKITAEQAVEVMRDFEKRHPLSAEQVFKSWPAPSFFASSLTVHSIQNMISSLATLHYSPVSFYAQAIRRWHEICFWLLPDSMMNRLYF